MRVLVVNAGSSTLKLSLLDAHDTAEHRAELAAGPDGIDTAALSDAMHGWRKPDVVGHRIVHGGTVFTGPVCITDTVRSNWGT